MPFQRVTGRSVRRICLSAFAGIVAAAALAGAALAQEPPASQIAAAKDVIMGSGISRSFSIFVPQILDQIKETITRTRPEYAADLDVVLKQIQPEFEARQADIIDQAAHVFARTMSEQELKETAAFFNSPSGKKYVEAQPIVLDEVVNDIQTWSQKLSTDMMDRVRVEMRKKGHDL